jgi:hypothetical protein
MARRGAAVDRFFARREQEQAVVNGVPAVLAYIDGFLAAAIGAYAHLFLTAFLKRH